MVRIALLLTLAASGALRAQAPDFARDIRPILSDRCYTCHGPDPGTRRAGLRLDVRDSAIATLPSGGRAIVPGSPGKSSLVARIHEADDERMPPPESKLSLDERERDLLQRWIEAGAPYARHWAFEPLPATVPVPATTEPGDNPIDAFVIARATEAVEDVEFSPSEQPGRALRRAALSLTGLPPTPDQVAEFLADNQPGAFERAVDHLLASPRYGERMASEWLDAARYADTFGYQNDVERPVWPWRDWAIRAFNDNVPYDRFATLQIAGDLLPGGERDAVLATAFQRLHRQTNEGGSVEEEMRLEYVADRTQTFATAFLGLTMECARCHDHKFDPLSQREYYGLSAFFDNIDESGLYSHFTRSTPTPALSLPNPEQNTRLEQARAKVERLESEHADRVRAAHAAFENRAPVEDSNARRTLEPVGATGHFPLDALAKGTLANRVAEGLVGKTADGPRVVPGRIGKALEFSGENNATFPKVADFDRHQPFSLAFWLRLPQRFDRAVVLHRSRSWTDAGSRGYELLLEHGRPSFALIHFWPGNAIRVRGTAPLAENRWIHVALTYDGSSRAAGLGIVIDGERAAIEVVRDRLTRQITGGGARALTLAQRFRDRGFKGGAVDDLRTFDRELTLGEIRTLHDPSYTPSDRERRDYYVSAVDPGMREHATQLRAVRVELGKTRDRTPEIMVMREMGQPRRTFVRPRGSYLAQGEEVTPHTPAALPGFPDGAPRNRLGLAQWLTASDHPLTARVFVNRIWQMHFGRGLVATPEDFGSQGNAPTHPQLLDWLARRFVDSRWDVKALHRSIVTSRAFRRSAFITPAMRQRDPENALLLRGPAVQLTAESLRDQALWVSGLLVERIGGPPVRPYQPAGLWKEKSGQTYRPSKGQGLYRRSLYTYWKRTSPPPAMMTLDASKRDVCVVRRQRTTSPQQALVMLNDPQFVEAARVWAERTLAREGTDRQRLTAAFERLLARSPRPRELDVMQRALAEQRSAFEGARDRAAKLIGVGDRPAADDLAPEEVAAWTMVLGILLNFDEAVRP